MLKELEAIAAPSSISWKQTSMLSIRLLTNATHLMPVEITTGVIGVVSVLQTFLIASLGTILTLISCLKASVESTPSKNSMSKLTSMRRVVNSVAILSR